MMLVQCEDCQARRFVAALVGDQTSLSAIESQMYSFADGGIATEPEPGHEHSDQPSHEGDPVTTDDVLEMHEFLDGFGGDFRAHFSR